MSDFEKMKAKLLDKEKSPYVEGKHFDIYEWSETKEIDLRPTQFEDAWIEFEFDKDGNLLRIV